MPFGMKIGETIGYKKEIFIGSLIIVGSIFLSSFFTNFWWFVIFYGIVFGLVNGALYIIPIRLGFMYFPHKKGIVSGLIVCGFGMGAFFLSYVAKYIINPDNYAPEIYNAQVKEYYFDHRVSDNVPFGIRVLSIIYLFTALIGVWLITDPTKDD